MRRKKVLSILLTIVMIAAMLSPFGVLAESRDELAMEQEAAVLTVPQSQMNATADSYQPGNEPYYAIDGKEDTIWHSSWEPYEEMPHSITLDLGGTYNVNGLKYLPRQDGNGNGRVNIFNIYVSTDGTNFTKVVDSASWGYEYTDEKYCEFEPVNASYVRLEALWAEGNFASAAEINITYAGEGEPGEPDDRSFVSVTYNETKLEDGVITWSGESPEGNISVVDGVYAYTTVLGGDNTGYIYVNIDDSFMMGGKNAVDVTVMYYDDAQYAGSYWEFAYDAANPWKYLDKIYLEGDNTWKTATFSLVDASFQNRCNGADLRIGTKSPLSIHSIKVEKKEQDISADPQAIFTNPATTVNMSIWTGDSGSSKHVTISDKPALEIGTPGQAQYIYCNIDDEYVYDTKTKLRIIIEYFDAKTNGSWSMAYNSMNAAWSYLDPVKLRGTETWKTQEYILDDARCANRCNGADFRIGTNNVPVAFHKVTVQKIESVVLEAKFDRMANLYFIGDTVKFDLNITNEKSKDEELTISYKVINHNNSSIYEGGFTQTVGAGQNFTKQIELGTFPRGSYFLLINAVNADKSVNINEKYRFGLIKDISDREFTIDNFGACVHFAQGKGDIDILVNLFKQAGISTLRDEYYWNRVETVKGQYNWVYDDYVTKLVENGQELLLILSYGNDLYGGGLPLTDEAREGFANYAAALAGHLKGKVKYFEVWNEWNGGGGSSAYNYYLLLKETYTAVKAANPDAYIVAAATVGYDYTFMKNLVDYGGWEYMDAISYHYPDRTRLAELASQISGYIKDNYGKDIPAWITEIGWANEFVEKGGKTELESTGYITQLYIDNHSYPGANEMIYYYDFQNDGTNPAEHEENFGLVTLEAGGAPKPSFVALNAAADLLNGTTIEAFYDDLIPDLRIRKFKDNNGGDDVLAIWSAKGEIPVSLNFGTNDLEFIDTFGNVVPYTTINGYLTFTAAELPVYLKGNFEQAPIVGQSGFTTDNNNIDVVPGEEVSVKVIRSSDVQNLSGNYRISIPEGWSVVSGQAFSAGSSEDVIVLKVGENYTAAAGKVDIYPESLEGKVYGHISINVKTVDSFSVEVSPVVKESGDGWNVRIRLINNYSTASIAKGSIMLEEPKESAGAYEFPEIAPKSYYDVIVPAPMLSGDWTTQFTFNIRTDDGYARNITRAISSLTAVRTAEDDNIQIDGVINESEWKNAMGFVLNDVSQTRNYKASRPWGGVSDLSAVGKVKWDDEYLYLAVSVTDDIHYMEDTFEFSWQADSVQISIDPGRIAGYNSIGHHRFNFSLNSETGESKIVVDGTDIAELSENLLKESLYKVLRDEANKKTNYELALKWSEILPSSRMPATSGLTDIGFSLLVNDSDGAERIGWIEYMSGIGFGKLPELFGDLILTDLTSITIPEVEKPGEEDYKIPPKEGNFVPQNQIKVVGSSPSKQGRGTEYLLDSDLDTRWESAAAPHWIILDLGKSYDVNSIWYQSQRDYDGGTIFRYSVYVGDDLSNLTKIVDGANAPAYIHGSTYLTIGEYALEFPDNASGVGRYVKLEILDSKYGDCRISEINIGFKPQQTPEGPAVVLTGDSTVEEGQDFDILVSLADMADNVYAEDIIIEYDATLFEYVDLTEVNTQLAGIKVIVPDEVSGEVSGKIQVLTINQQIISGNLDLFKIKFRAKQVDAATNGDIGVVKAELGTAPEGTVIVAEADSLTVSVANVDKSALAAAIADALSVHDAAVEGDTPGKYPVGSKAELMAAITQAQAILNNQNATQSQVDDSVSALQSAVAAFQAKLIVAVKEDLNRDGIVDVGDLAIAAYYYRTDSNSENWDEAKIADINDDGVVDILDLAGVAERVLSY